jgi:hypothetical protein
LGAGVTFHDGLSEDTVDFSSYRDMTFISGTAHVRPSLVAPALFLSAMPLPVPVRLDAEFGIAFLTRASPLGDIGVSKSSGLYLGAGLGWEAEGDYVDVGLSGKVYLTNTDDDGSAYSTTGYGVVLNLGTHPRRAPEAQ